MQPYDDLAGHYRRSPAETVVVVGLDVLALSMAVLTVVGVLRDLPILLWVVVLAGIGFVSWVVGIWNAVANWRNWG